MSIYDIISNQNFSFNKEAWAAQKQAQRKEAYEIIDNTCAEMATNGDSFRQYLDMQGRFDRYSVANAILVSAQMPEATQLRDYGKWKENRIYVNKGAEKITILEPGKEYTRKDGTTATSFNAKDVYDISQTSSKVKTTNTKPIPMRELLSALVEASPVKIKTDDKLETAAYYDCSKQTIFVKTGLNEHQLIAGTTKEVAAAIYDDKYKMKREDTDFKSYCVAYMLCSKYNVETKGFSFDKLPPEINELEPKDLRSELNSMRDVLGEINDIIYKSIEKYKPAKSQEQER